MTGPCRSLNNTAPPHHQNQGSSHQHYNNLTDSHNNIRTFYTSKETEYIPPICSTSCFPLSCSSPSSCLLRRHPLALSLQSRGKRVLVAASLGSSSWFLTSSHGVCHISLLRKQLFSANGIMELMLTCLCHS